ncbi:MAG TPA: 50S ribosomal protein L29 [Dehalococcoidia bacterium]|nr:50S ribosomal protein L29 [Dehalococcoidia bacterium]
MTTQNSEAERVRTLSDGDLDKEIDETRRRLFDLRLQSSTRQLENYRELRKVRRQVARLETVKRARGLAGEGQ